MKIAHFARIPARKPIIEIREFGKIPCRSDAAEIKSQRAGILQDTSRSACAAHVLILPQLRIECESGEHFKVTGTPGNTFAAFLRVPLAPFACG